MIHQADKTGADAKKKKARVAPVDSGADPLRLVFLRIVNENCIKLQEVGKSVRGSFINQTRQR